MKMRIIIELEDILKKTQTKKTHHSKGKKNSQTRMDRFTWELDDLQPVNSPPDNVSSDYSAMTLADFQTHPTLASPLVTNHLRLHDQ